MLLLITRFNLSENKSMDGKSVIKILENWGWKHVRTKGSHHILKKQGFLPIVVPVHGKQDLKPGTLKNIERNTGIKLK